MTITAVPPPASPYDQPAIVRLALDWLEGQVRQTRPLDSPTMVRDYLRLWLADRPHEVFAAVFLDAQHHVIDARELLPGSLSQTSVYPREVAVEALQMHAAALIVAHNHPSGSSEPSRADIALTQKLKACLGLLDIWLRPLDPMSRWRAPDHGVVDRESSGQRRSLQPLAQEYSAKLQQAGYSVTQGIAALQQDDNSVSGKPRHLPLLRQRFKRLRMWCIRSSGAMRRCGCCSPITCWVGIPPKA